MTEALRLFAFDHPLVARTLHGRLLRRQAELVAQLGAGNAEDFADYRGRVGVIKGLQEAIETCAQVNKETGD